MHVFPADPAEAAAAENEALREWTVDGTVVPSSGPLVFESWEKGSKMTMVRNDAYHGSVSPDVTNTGAAFVDTVEINFVPDTDAQINALKAGEAQIIFTQPQTQFEELVSDDTFTVASSAGPVYEHWGFDDDNVHLAKPEVREAIARDGQGRGDDRAVHTAVRRHPAPRGPWQLVLDEQPARLRRQPGRSGLRRR